MIVCVCVCVCVCNQLKSRTFFIALRNEQKSV